MCVVLVLLRHHESVYEAVCTERDRLRGDLDTLQVKVSGYNVCTQFTHTHSLRRDQ